MDSALGPMTFKPSEAAEMMTTETGHRSSRIIWGLIYAVSLLAILWYVAEGASYYTTPFKERPRHADYRDLRPAGPRGLAFGVAGSAMMILMHVYSLRKRSRRMRRWGGTRQWLNLHIYLGIMGPVLIVLHTSFKVQGLVAVAFWSMVGVALSGFVGRYLYQLIPRNIHGVELTASELEQRSLQLREMLARDGRISKGTQARIDEITEPSCMIGAGPVRALFALGVNDLRRPLTRHHIRKALARDKALRPSERRMLLELTLRCAILRRRARLLEVIHRAFHYWHVIHKPFAIVMYAIMAVHITVAVWTGYGWVF